MQRIDRRKDTTEGQRKKRGTNKHFVFGDILNFEFLKALKQVFFLLYLVRYVSYAFAGYIFYV